MTCDEKRTNSLYRWLIVRQGAIGDTILLSPLIQSIRFAYPHAWIELMGVRERVELLVGEGLADSAASSERSGMERLYSDDSPLPNELIDYLHSFDVILYFAGNNRERLRRRLPIRPETITRVYPALPSPAQGLHCAHHYLGILDGLIEVKSPPVPRLALRSDEIDEVENDLRSQGIDRNRAFVFALHIGAGSLAKRAPLELFVQIAESFYKQAVSVCWVAQGPADSDAVSQFQAALAGREVRVLKELPLRKLAAILSLAQAMIGNDSGITHMAAAVGCPTLALFTGSDPEIWRPLGDRARSLLLSERYRERFRFTTGKT